MKRLFGNTIISSVDSFILVALNLAATPILIEHLGIAQYGVFVFLSIFSTYGLLSLFDFGMEGALLNFIARFEAVGDRKRIQDCLSISVLFYAAVGVALATALYFLADLIASRFADDTGQLNLEAVQASIRIVSANVLVQFLTLPFICLLQGLRRFVVTKSVNAMMTITRYSLVIAVAVTTGRIDLAFAVILGVSLLQLVILVSVAIFKVKLFRSLSFDLEIDLVKSLFSYSSLLIVSRLIGIVFNYIDKMLIWLYLTVTQMAIYDIVVRPGNLIRMLISIINSAVIPEVAFLHQKKDLAGIRDLFVNLVRYAYLLIVPVLAVAYPFMESLLAWWVGGEFSPYFYMSWVLLAAYLIAPVPSVASTMVVGLELVRKTIWISIVATIINIVLSLVLLEIYGLLGLLLATLAAEMFMGGPYLMYMKRYINVSYLEVAKPIALIAAIALPFATANYFLVEWTDGSFLQSLPVIILLIGIHVGVEYRYLLSPYERQFVRAKIGLGGSKQSTGERSV